MSKMSELAAVLDDLVACGEQMIRTAKALRGIFQEEPAQTEQPATAAAPTTSAATAAPVAAQTEPQKTYTFVDVRKAFAAKSHAGFTDKVKALITSYGAEKLSAIKEEDYPSLMEKLEAIK